MLLKLLIPALIGIAFLASFVYRAEQRHEQTIHYKPTAADKQADDTMSHVGTTLKNYQDK